MKARKITAISIAVGFLIFLGLEGWLVSNDEEGDTISEVVHETGKKWMCLPFLLGYLMGHWTWPIYNKKGK